MPVFQAFDSGRCDGFGMNTSGGMLSSITPGKNGGVEGQFSDSGPTAQPPLLRHSGEDGEATQIQALVVCIDRKDLPG